MTAENSLPFTLANPIRFTHTDPAGFVFFPRYFEMLQAVTEEWISERLGVAFADLILRRRLGQPTAHTECEFVKPCRLGEILDIALVVERVGKSSMTIRFTGSVDGETRLRARSVQVLVDMDTGRPVALDGDLGDAVRAYMADVVPPDDIGPTRRG